MTRMQNAISTFQLKLLHLIQAWTAALPSPQGLLCLWSVSFTFHFPEQWSDSSSSGMAAQTLQSSSTACSPCSEPGLQFLHRVGTEPLLNKVPPLPCSETLSWRTKSDSHLSQQTSPSKHAFSRQPATCFRPSHFLGLEQSNQLSCCSSCTSLNCSLFNLFFLRIKCSNGYYTVLFLNHLHN